MSGSHSRAQAHLSFRSSSPFQLELYILHRGSKPHKRTRMNQSDDRHSMTISAANALRACCRAKGSSSHSCGITHTTQSASAHRAHVIRILVTRHIRSSPSSHPPSSSTLNVNPTRPPCGFKSTSTPCGTGNKKLQPRLRQHKPHDSIHMSSSTAHHPHLHPNPPPSATSHRKHRPRPRQRSRTWFSVLWLRGGAERPTIFHQDIF